MSNEGYEHDGLFSGWDDGGPTRPDNLSARAVFYVRCGKAIQELGAAIRVLGSHLDKVDREDQLIAVEDVHTSFCQLSEQIEDGRRFSKADAVELRKALGMSQP